MTEEEWDAWSDLIELDPREWARQEARKILQRLREVADLDNMWERE